MPRGLVALLPGVCGTVAAVWGMWLLGGLPVALLTLSAFLLALDWRLR